MPLKSTLRSAIRRIGFEVTRFPGNHNTHEVRRKIMSTLGIDLVLDVGANVGRYGRELYEAVYHGSVVSFEPVSSLFAELRQTAAGRPNWSCHHLALGETDGTAEINVAHEMSSLLPRSPSANGSIPFTDTRREQIKIAKLDSIRDQVFGVHQRIWLKMDVQGFELSVLKGAAQSLTDIVAVEAEMSLWAFYSGQPGYRELIDHLDGCGFGLWSVQPGHRDPDTARMIEMDGIFVRKDFVQVK